MRPALCAPLLLLAVGCSLVPSKDALLDPDSDGDLWGEDCDNTDPDNDCDEEEDSAVDDTGPWPDTDEDGDGYLAGEDCDDTDPAISPAALESCDGVDNDCDGHIDEGFSEIWSQDADGDGFGDPGVQSACPAPEGYVEDASDCDDSNPSTFPGADEVCGDGSVNNCRWTESQALDACIFEGDLDLGVAETQIWGAESGGRLGYDLSLRGDLDGDGLADALVSATLAADVGLVYAFGAPAVGALGSADADASLSGEDTDDSAGFSVSAGDADGDGYDDVAVGAPFNSSADTYAGAAYLELAPLTGSASLADVHARVYGQDFGGRLGYAVELGDITGDGCADLWVGAPELSSAFVFGAIPAGAFTPSGADLSLVGEAGEGTGQAGALGGDVDGDGVGDMIVGAPYYDVGGETAAGQVYLVLGGAHSGALSADDADFSYGVSVSRLYLGVSATLDGDLDGDGYRDLAFGVEGYDATGDGAEGAVYVIPGTNRDFSDSDVLQVFGEVAGDQAGRALAAGDVDADGKDDLAIGAPGRDYGADDSGMTYLLYGPVRDSTDLVDADARFIGEAYSDLSGASVSVSAGLGGASADLLIGAWGHDTSDADLPGIAYLFRSLRY